MICTKCQKHPAASGRRKCPTCLADNAHAAKMRYQRNKEDGLCPRCRQHPPEPGRKGCTACLLKARHTMALRKARSLILPSLSFPS